MFVKVDEGVYVNLMNVSEVRENGTEMKVFYNDGQESTVVKDKREFLYRMNTFNMAIQRLAIGSF